MTCPDFSLCALYFTLKTKNPKQSYIFYTEYENPDIQNSCSFTKRLSPIFMCLDLYTYHNQRAIGPVNAHLISRPHKHKSYKTKIKMTEQLLNLITYNPLFNHQGAIISKEKKTKLQNLTLL